VNASAERSIVGSSSDEQGAAEQTLLDRTKLGASIVLTLFEIGDALQVDEMFAMTVALFQPGSGSHRELGRAVDLVDVDETRILK
jgi:hypothetical protein